MGNTNPFKDLDAHQELMDQLQKTTDAANESINAATNALTELSDHNIDLEAHPALRQRIAALESAVDESGSKAIEEHNESALSHPDIRELIEKNEAYTDTVKASIATSIEDHSNDENAHPAIQAKVNDLSIRVGKFNIVDLNDKITEMSEELNTQIKTDILNLQSVDAKHDKLISANILDIANNSKKISVVNSHLAKVAGYITSHQTAIDAVTLKARALELEELLGYPRYNAAGPNLLNFTTDLGLYIKNNASLEFHLNGTTLSASGGNLEYKVTKGDGDFTVSSAVEPIVNGSPVTITVGENNHPGDIIYFTVEAKDSVAQVSVKRVITLMIAKDLDTGLIELTSLKTNVEPGKSYTFQVVNLADAGDGTYSYAIENTNADLTFSKVSEIKDSEDIVMTVSESAVRESVYELNLVISDIYGGSFKYPITVKVNKLPSLSTFSTNLPDILVPGKTYDVSFDGIVSAQNNEVIYGVSCDSEYVTFSKTENILPRENIKLVVKDTAPRGTSIQCEVNTKDENEVVLHIPREFIVNLLPDSSDIITSLPMTTAGGKQIEFFIYGGTDRLNRSAAAEAADPTLESAHVSVDSYIIDGGDSSLRFSKLKDIAPNEKITVTVPKVGEEKAVSFSVYAVDNDGEKSLEPKKVNLIIEPILIMNPPTITYPKADAKLDRDAVELRWTEAGYSIDVDQILMAVRVP